MSRVPVVIILYEGVSSHEAAGALAALRAAHRPAETAGPEALVRSQEGMRLVPDRLGWDALPAAPAAILPSGDVRKPLADAALARALRARRGHFTLAAGDAVHLLASAGLADGRRIARVPGEPALPGATSVHARLVADARLLTSFPGDALVDLVLHWIGHEDGAETGQRAAEAMGREWKPFAFAAGQAEDVDASKTR